MSDKKKKRKGGNGRPVGMRVVFCKECGRRVTGYPRKKVTCKGCGTTHLIPQKQ